MAVRLPTAALQTDPRAAAAARGGVHGLGAHTFVTLFAGSTRADILAMYHDDVCPRISVKDVIEASNPTTVTS